MAAPENSTMTECTKAMVDGLKAASIDSIADELLSATLLAEDVYEGLLPTKTKEEKAREVVRSVASKVKTNPTVEFKKFLDILRQHEGLEHLVKTLESKYIGKKGNPGQGRGNSDGGSTPPTVKPLISDSDDDEEDVTKVLKTDVMKEKYKKLKARLTKKGLEKWDEDIESDQHLRLIAEKMNEWERKHDLLKLPRNPDVQDLIDRYSHDPFKQRKYALTAWKNKVVYPTYHSLLCICIAGEWMDSANIIIEILEKDETGEDTDILETQELKMKHKKLMRKVDKKKKAELNEDISDDGHLRHIAEKLTGWEDKPDLLKLKDNPDVQDIVHSRRDPYAQKREALERWRNREVTPTYHKLLCICIAGSWTDAANQIVEFFK